MSKQIGRGEEKKKLVMETVGHVQQLKDRMNELKCDTDSDEKTLSLILDDNTGLLDEKVEADLNKIDNLLEDVAKRLKLANLLDRNVKFL